MSSSVGRAFCRNLGTLGDRSRHRMKDVRHLPCIKTAGIASESKGKQGMLCLSVICLRSTMGRSTCAVILFLF